MLGLVVIYAALFYVSYLFIRRIYDEYTSPIKDVPSPPGYGILGHFPTTIRTEILEMFRQWIPNYSKDGLMRYNPLVGSERLVVSNPEYIKKILITESHKFSRPVFLKDNLPLHDGIFISSGPHHAWQRKLLHPTFSTVSINRFDGLFERHALELVKHWENKINDSGVQAKRIQVEHDLQLSLLNIIGDAAFGYEFDNFNKKDSTVMNAFHSLIVKAFYPMQLLKTRYLGFLGSYIKYVGGLDRQSAIKIAHDTIREVIAAKRAKWADQTVKDSGNKKKLDLLELMLGLQDEESGKKMSEDLLIQNVLTFMLAGFETSSTSLTWTLYLLARHPEIQERAREEVVKATLKDSSISRENIDEMPFITCILKESLRMYPPGPIVGRDVVTPVQFGDLKLPKDCEVIVPLVYIQRNEEFWTRPDDFMPERFLNPDDSSKEKGHQYLPFSLGPRNCIGSKFAMLEMRIILAVLLKSLKFSISRNHPVVKMSLALTLRPDPTPELLVERA